LKEEKIVQDVVKIYLDRKLFHLTYNNLNLISEFIKDQIDIRRDPPCYWNIKAGVVVFTSTDVTSDEVGIVSFIFDHFHTEQSIRQKLNDFRIKHYKSDEQFYIGEMIISI
jgi:hypothetical protein